MRNIVMVLIQHYIRVLSIISPKAASKKAQDIFFTPTRHAPKIWEADSVNNADNIVLEGGIHCLVWGREKNKTILFVHGWEGRASQMSVFLPYLADKYRIIALNAPAHGQSEGNRSHPHKFIKAIFAAQNHFGPFHAIVGHSMGGGCAVYAAIEQLEVHKVVSIAGPSNFENVVSAFAHFIGLRGKALKMFMLDAETEVGLPFSTLDLASRVQTINQNLLIIHDEQDIEIPFAEGRRYEGQIKQGEFFATQGLGHRKIMQSDKVLQKVTDFIN
jgi:pimeloyl-ACP methyl ester carboxylesterase